MVGKVAAAPDRAPVSVMAVTEKNEMAVSAARRGAPHPAGSCLNPTLPRVTSNSSDVCKSNRWPFGTRSAAIDAGHLGGPLPPIFNGQTATASENGNRSCGENGGTLGKGWGSSVNSLRKDKNLTDPIESFACSARWRIRDVAPSRRCPESYSAPMTIVEIEKRPAWG
jgi:hypothetical protein